MTTVIRKLIEGADIILVVGFLGLIFCGLKRIADAIENKKKADL